MALSALATEYDNKRRELIKKYAIEQSPYKLGDRVTDHVGTIEIQKIRATIGFNEKYPSCIYDGIQYNKDGKLSKKQDHTTIHQTNIITNQ